MSRGSLSLSANAIVILVLAMTLLGLGIAFINDVFGSLTSTTLEVTETVRESIIEDLRSGNTRLSFPGSEVIVERNRDKIIALGIRNLESTPATFRVQIIGTRGTSNSYIFQDDTVTTGASPPDNECDPDFACFTYSGGACTSAACVKQLDRNADLVLPILIAAQGNSKTVKYTLKVEKLAPAPSSLYAQKDFFVTVN